MKFRIASWNVNGLRAIAKKGFFEWKEKEKYDVVCLQETKIGADQLTKELMERKGYTSYFSHAEKKGYSGVAIYTREKPREILNGFGIQKFDSEGRTVIADYGDFLLANIYFPNGKASPERLAYKMEFYEAFLKYSQKLQKEGKRLIVCGDFNTAHKEIDLAHPKDNHKISGFLPQERDWMDRFEKAGHIDTFRIYNQGANNYTWWHMMTNARARNVGWRIDYFFIHRTLEKITEHASIEAAVLGSDHCPVTLTLKV